MITVGTARFLNGIDVMVEGILRAVARDQAAGRHVAGFVTGYRGSPLGNVDMALWRAEERLANAKVTFRPGLNEDLAATACWGTQQAGLLPKPKYEGVVAFWYGKGPGVDRSLDAIKHGNLAGTSALGGVVLMFGDDHGCKSSSIPHQSEQSLIAAGVPILNPATVQEYYDYLSVAVELSRYAGLWVGMKFVTETVESGQIVHLAEPDEPQTAGFSGAVDVRPTSVFGPMRDEQHLYEERLPAATRFAVLAGIDRVLWHGAERRIGIVAAGKALVDTIEALRLLGFDEKRAAAAGIGVFKPLMTWPLEPTVVTKFMQGYDEVFVVEEKRALIEEQLAGLLLRMATDERPVLSGKQACDGKLLLPTYGEINAGVVADGLAARFVAVGITNAVIEARLNAEMGEGVADSALQTFTRAPMFCSGCPHNRSTKVPDGSMAFGGIGCHGMAPWIPGRSTLMGTHMGAEGSNWIGIEPFSGTEHIFQNMGDGTYSHSGLLAIRASIAAGSNITYKLLFNAAVAMTGGQPVEMQMSPLDAARQMLAEGAARVALVTEDVTRFPKVPEDVSLHSREELDTVQKAMRAVKGVTVIVYDQGCAAERRRLRKRKEWPDPSVHTFINPAVCEGCGDCSAKSTCVSIVPVFTELGIKRGIDQDSCNKDYTCTEGFCPSFVTVKGGSLRRESLDHAVIERLARALPSAQAASARLPYNLVAVGIGGTGIVTLGRLIARAAEHEGLNVSTFDVTGLAQKNGSVFSHIRFIAPDDEGYYRPRVPEGQLDLLLGCDIVGSASPDMMPLYSRTRTRAVVSDALTQTASFQSDPDNVPMFSAYMSSLRGAIDALDLVPAVAASAGLVSGPLLNLYILGFAVQQGLLPVSDASIEAVIGHRELDLTAFRLGRVAAHDTGAIQRFFDTVPPVVPLAARPFEEMVSGHAALLEKFQNVAYATRYVESVRAVEAADTRGEFAQAVGVGLFRVMYYKDEYEVARLHASPEFRVELDRRFKGKYKLEYNLAPPLISRRGPDGVEPRKIKFGTWMVMVFRILARGKMLRGTIFDPFGRTADRRLDRDLITEYSQWIKSLTDRLDQIDYAMAVEIARLPETMRGYGHVKARNVQIARERKSDLEARLLLSPTPETNGDRIAESAA